MQVLFLSFVYHSRNANLKHLIWKIANFSFLTKMLLKVELLHFSYKNASNSPNILPCKGPKIREKNCFPLNLGDLMIWCASGRLLDNPGTKQNTLYKA